MNTNTHTLLASTALCAALLAGCSRSIDTFTATDGTTRHGNELTVKAGDAWLLPGTYTHFTLTGKALTRPGAEAALLFHTDTACSRGYEMTLRGGPIDGTRKTGSLAAVRNLYRPLADNGAWFPFEVSVRGQRISISINHTLVVNYTEPTVPYRTAEYADRLLGRGRTALRGVAGEVSLRNLHVTRISPWQAARGDTLAPPDEAHDPIIRLQQRNFPVIDYHVHLKGGLTKELAHRMSLDYGINYGVAPNAGEGGVGRMLADDHEVYEYFAEVKDMPFLRGVQGEGRRWTATFSPEALGVFDYLFTDAMTIVDHRGRLSRIYRPEEVHYDGITREQYMDHLVEQTVLILTNEPADIYANPTYLPNDMQADYARYWTDERIDRVLDVLARHGIALEINARYRIPSFDIIRRAKERGIKFTFGTNNVDADFGRLEYCVQAIDSCGLTPADLWWPSMSTRRNRPVVLYNDLPPTPSRFIGRGLGVIRGLGD